MLPTTGKPSVELKLTYEVCCKAILIGRVVRSKRDVAGFYGLRNTFRLLPSYPVQAELARALREVLGG